MGRADEPHLDSAMPLVCLVLGHALSVGFRKLWPEGRGSRALRGLAVAALGAGCILLWGYLSETDRYLKAPGRGVHKVRTSRQGLLVRSRSQARHMDVATRLLRKHTKPGETILTMGPTPAFYVLSERLGPGTNDIIMPGIFRSDEEEAEFIARLEASPPAAVVWSERLFDPMPERSLFKTAPALSIWVLDHYKPPKDVKQKRWIVLLHESRFPAKTGS